MLVFDSTTGAITDVVVDTPGSGYSFAPHLVIRDGTVANPVNGGSGATATATLTVQNVVLNTYGAGYTSAPTVTISDSIGGTGSGAMATATFETSGAVTGITNLVGGSGYLTAGGIKKFQDGLPMLCDPSVTDCSTIANNLGQYIPLAVPDTTTFTTANGFSEDADYYVIALVQHREQMNSSLPATGTLQREYVQLIHDCLSRQASRIDKRPARRHLGASFDARRFAGLRGRRPALHGADHSGDTRTSRSGSSSTTCCRPAPTATCSSRWTPPSWAPAWGRWI